MEEAEWSSFGSAMGRVRYSVAVKLSRTVDVKAAALNYKTMGTGIAAAGAAAIGTAMVCRSYSSKKMMKQG